MYKLVAVGGKIRGKEIVLNEGENTIGRSPEADHQLDLSGVSKKHISITVNGQSAYLEDLGSSNGTFVNGKLVKRKTVVNQDKITLPDVIFQVVYVRENKVLVKKQVQKTDEVQEDLDFDLKEAKPKNVPDRIKLIFKSKVMPVFYGFNESYQWRTMLGILLFLFVCINILLVISPVLRDSRKLLIIEIGKRGAHYADEVARLNAGSLSRNDLDRLDTSFLEGSGEGIVSYELFDMEGRIVRPISKLNTYIKDPFSVEVKEVINANRNRRKNHARLLSNGMIGIGQGIVATNARTGRQETVGIISIKFQPETLQAQAANNSKAYLESLITSAAVALLFFFIIYYLTIRPLTEMRHQLELAARGKKKELESKLLMDEVKPLRKSINSTLARLRELDSDGVEDFDELEDDGPYLQTLKSFLEGAQGAALVLTSEKNIENMNPSAEDLLGIRENSSVGENIMDMIRDQGLSATMIDLCDKSANDEGRNYSEFYEVGGRDYNVNVCGLVGKDSFAKGFFVTFVEE